jgi:phenylalanyl-tRNA synthetase alpha chain
MAYTVPKLKDYSAAALDQAVQELLSALEQEAKGVSSEADWKTFRDRWMARKNGVLTQVNDLWLKAAPKDAKRDVGQRVNQVKQQVEEVVGHPPEWLGGARHLPSGHPPPAGRRTPRN